MTILLRFALLLIVSACTTLGSISIAYAETQSITIQENDTLSGIVQKAYPGYGNRNAIMQLILQRNPNAFQDNNINFLILGRVLELPGTDELADLDSPPPSPAVQQVSDSPVERTGTQQRLQEMNAEREALESENSKLKLENESLQKQALAVDGQLTSLQAARDALIKEKQGLERRLSELQETDTTQTSPEDDLSQQLKSLQRDNDNLRTDNEQLQTNFQAAKEQLKLNDDSLKTLHSDRAQLQTGLKTTQSQLSASTTDQEALRADNEQLQADLQAARDQLATGESDLETLRADNGELQADLQAARDQLALNESDLEILRADNTQLQSDLQAAKDQLVLNESDTETLRDGLEAADHRNTALQIEIDQIKAAAAKDVTLAPTEISRQSIASLWPWFLMLLLLPLAWLLGQRSRPAPETAVAVQMATDSQALIDPVIPAAALRVRNGLETTGFSEAAIIPDDPDVAIKLDMARAYLDLRNAEAANDVLKEVIREGGSQQRREAQEILSFLS